MKNEILKYIYEKDQKQKKKLTQLLKTNKKISDCLDDFLNMYQPYMVKYSISAEELADAYIFLVAQVIHSRIEFIQTGHYPVKKQKDAFDNVYNNKELMRRYMLGLALSQFLWEHHFEMYNFYINEIKKMKTQKNYLEVGCGHGLYLLALLNNIEDFERLDVVDISEASLEITKGLLETIKPSVVNRINFIKSDIADYNTEIQYDFIAMGEVLEHVENPGYILKNLHQLLNNNGKLFLTTCANCPTIDHVYYFKNIQEIRNLLAQSCFSIENEIEIPSEKVCEEKIEKYKIDIVYATILKRNDNE